MSTWDDIPDHEVVDSAADMLECYGTAEIQDRLRLIARRMKADREHGEAVLRTIAGLPREPKPTDGPDFHADHAAWELRKGQII